MKLRIRILEWRMKLGLDPWARAARERKNKLDFALEQARIKMKAMHFEHHAASTGEIVIHDAAPDADGGETVFEMPKRVAEKPLAPYKLDDTGIDVVFDPTDSDTVELMQQYEFGSAIVHEREETFNHQVDPTPPKPVDFDFEWDGPADPFAGIKNLG